MKVSNTLKFQFIFLIIFSPYLLFAEEKGAPLVKKHCAECHGNDGNGNPQREDIIPKIAGFSAFFIYDTLAQFNNDDRKGKRITNNKNQEPDMNQISK
jgi:cytochrome c553